MDDLDALLADLENTSSHISKRPAVLPETPTARPMDSGTICPSVIHSDGHRRDTAGSHQPPPPAYTPQQVNDGRTGSTALMVSASLPLSTVCKPKAGEQAPPGNSTMVGSGLSELDRLLQELNTAQFNITDEILAQFPPGKAAESREGARDPGPGSGLADEGTPQKPVAGEVEEEVTSKEMGSGPHGLVGVSTPREQAKTSATSATLELDKLMESLSDFQLHSQPPAQPCVPVLSPGPVSEIPVLGPAPNLDNMLGMLQSNLHRQGIVTVPKGSCTACRKPIVGQPPTPRPHPPTGFHERDGKPYCRKDFYHLFASRCHGCGQAILENYISALNALWHPECFVCRDCYTPFVNGSFFEFEGQPFCEVHYHRKRGSLCSACEKPITGRCITAMGVRFHPKHFVCAFCLKQLNKGTFKEQNDKPYCHPCFTKLFG
ncbi:paxillin-like [Rhincodon typus]|uniref:paxillin-like n=1 Tax=Rhincodon typus TaxID=259920 RepID=UPI00202EAF10|nr:paxillin-like [Rhincodon typus]